MARSESATRARTRSDSKDSLLLPVAAATEMGVGAARKANSEEEEALVLEREDCAGGGGGDESKEKRRASRSELPDGSWKWG